MQNVASLEHNDLYQAMMNWSSVRRYDQRPLPQQTLDKIQAEVQNVAALIPPNQFVLPVRDVVTGDDLVAALGAYGRVLSPTHFMVPYIIGRSHLLMDLGYRTHQIVVKMSSKGIGCCYIGSLGRETTLRARFVLRRQARIGAVVIFGRPAAAVTGRTINTAMRRAMGSNKRLPLDQIFFQNNFRRATVPPKNLKPLLEAARRAPSGHNVQPCRFLWRRKTLYLFVNKDNPKYGKGIKQDYRFFDAGVCMANMTLTLKAMGLTPAWTLVKDSPQGIPDHPDGLEPLASVQIPTL